MVSGAESRMMTPQTRLFTSASTAGPVNVWLADGALRGIPPEAVALDWTQMPQRPSKSD